VYEGLNDVPWFAAMGNHDYGSTDLYATCPEKAPLKVINGQVSSLPDERRSTDRLMRPYPCLVTQAYASNQLDEDKGGYRAGGKTTNFHMPDFNYR
jgi:hypothetical protein